MDVVYTATTELLDEELRQDLQLWAEAVFPLLKNLGKLTSNGTKNPVKKARGLVFNFEFFYSTRFSCHSASNPNWFRRRINICIKVLD